MSEPSLTSFRKQADAKIFEALKTLEASRDQASAKVSGQAKQASAWIDAGKKAIVEKVLKDTAEEIPALMATASAIGGAVDVKEYNPLDPAKAEDKTEIDFILKRGNVKPRDGLTVVKKTESKDAGDGKTVVTSSYQITDTKAGKVIAVVASRQMLGADKTQTSRTDVAASGAADDGEIDIYQDKGGSVSIRRVTAREKFVKVEDNVGVMVGGKASEGSTKVYEEEEVLAAVPAAEKPKVDTYLQDVEKLKQLEASLLTFQISNAEALKRNAQSRRTDLPQLDPLSKKNLPELKLTDLPPLGPLPGEDDVPLWKPKGTGLPKRQGGLPLVPLDPLPPELQPFDPFARKRKPVFPPLTPFDLPPSDLPPIEVLPPKLKTGLPPVEPKVTREDIAKKLADATGLTKMFDGKATVTVKDGTVDIFVPDEAMAKVPEAARKAYIVKLNDAFLAEFGKSGAISGSIAAGSTTGGQFIGLARKPGTDDKTLAADVDTFVAAQAKKTETVAAAAVKAAMPTREQMAKKIADASGITEKFGDKAKVKIEDDLIKIELTREALEMVPAGSRATITEQLGKALTSEFKKTSNLLMGVTASGDKGTGKDVRLSLKTPLDEMVLSADVEKFAAAQKGGKIVKDALAAAKEDQIGRLASTMSTKVGVGSMSRDGATVASIELPDNFDIAKMSPKLKAAFQKNFGFGGDDKMFTFAEEQKYEGKPKSKIMKVDLKAAADYDDKNGEGAFAAQLDKAQADIKASMMPEVAPPAADPAKPPATTTPPPQPGIVDMLSDNKGMGIGGIIGAIIGWLIGGPIGVAIGALVLGGFGAVMDGKKGVLGLGGDPETAPPAMTDKLKKEVSAYAQVRFTDFNTGKVDQTKADKFVERYGSIVAKDMSPADQDKRADAIALKTAEIKGKVREAAEKASVPDMEKAMTEAVGTMKTTDATLIQLNDAAVLPSTDGAPKPSVPGVKAAAQRFK